MAFTNVGSDEDLFSGITSQAYTASVAVPDLAATSIGFVCINLLATGATGRTITSVTWNGVAMFVGSNSVHPTTGQQAAIYYLANPSDNNTYNIVVTFSGAGLIRTLSIITGWSNASGEVSLDDTSAGTGSADPNTIVSTQVGSNELVIVTSVNTANALATTPAPDSTELQSWDSGGDCTISSYVIPVGSGDTTITHDYSQVGTYAIASISFKEAAGVVGTLAKTLDNLTSSSSGKVTDEADLSKTLAGIVFSSEVDNAINSTLSKVLGNVTLSSEGTVASYNFGNLSKTLEAATLSSSGKVTNESDLSKTLANIQNTANGLGTIGGSLDNALENDTFDAEADVAIDADLAKTLENVILSSNGTVGASTNTANLNITLDNATASSIGNVAINSNVSKILENITNVSNGSGAIGGSTGETLENDTFDSEVDVAINSNLSKTLADATLSSEGLVGTVTAVATLNVTLESIANVSNATNAIGGDEDTTLDNDTFDAEVDVNISGNSSVSLADILFYSSGVVGAQTIGTLDVTLDGATSSGAGTVAVDGDLSVVLAVVTLIATGIVTPLPVVPSTHIPKLKYDVLYYDRSFEVSEYNRTNRIEKDLTWKLKDAERTNKIIIKDTTWELEDTEG